jgi:hypothetical protein
MLGAQPADEEQILLPQENGLHNDHANPGGHQNDWGNWMEEEVQENGNGGNPRE